MPLLMSDVIDVDAVILAGGLGTRLRPILNDRPKVMADVNGRPFIALLLDQLEKFGFNEVVLSTGYRAESVFEYFGYRYGKMNLIYSKEETPLGTGGALKLAQVKLRKDHVLVMNGDSLVDFDYHSFFLLAYQWGE